MYSQIKIISILIFICIAFNLSLGNEGGKNNPNWIDYDLAIKKAKSENKFIIAKLYADWCGPCKVMDDETFADSVIINMVDDNFIATKLDVESKTIISCDNWPRPTLLCVSENWQIKGIPTIMIIGPSGYNLLQISQFLDVNQMKAFLANLITGKDLLKEADQEMIEEFAKEKNNVNN